MSIRMCATAIDMRGPVVIAPGRQARCPDPGPAPSPARVVGGRRLAGPGHRGGGGPGTWTFEGWWRSEDAPSVVCGCETARNRKPADDLTEEAGSVRRTTTSPR